MTSCLDSENSSRVLRSRNARMHVANSDRQMYAIEICVGGTEQKSDGETGQGGRSGDASTHARRKLHTSALKNRKHHRAQDDQAWLGKRRQAETSGLDILQSTRTCQKMSFEAWQSV
jgi:hypothetical protein